MSQQLSAQVDELFDLVRKSQGIISTHSASDLEDSAASVEDIYRTYAETHISLGDTSGFEQDVYDSVVTGEDPTKGYLYGPFGYGKTSTSVSIWNELNQNNIIAVPPFTVTSFSAIMRATFGWMRYKLQDEAPSYLDDLEEIKDRYLQKEIRSYAEEKISDYDMGVDALVDMFAEMEEDGELDLSLDADTLIDFFNDCTKLALEADFDGLVVVGDELQQYFKGADNRQEAEVRFREFVFGLHTGAKIDGQFGFFVSMPEQTKSSLDTRAGDVLNRLESDGLMLNLKNVYGQDFPSELWEKYAARFNFEDKQNDVISEHALKSIGEICSRPELSNGPRTVIDIFRIVFQQYQSSKEQFTVLDIAEAFYEGEVRYQGNSTIIQSAIGDALDHSSVSSEKQQQFIKICAVFPESGIPDEVVDKYELSDAREYLSKKLHGEVIKVIADGYTLIDVTRTDGPQDVVRELIRDFWDSYDTDHPNARHAHNTLANRVVCGRIFESKRGTLDSWAIGDGLSKEAERVYREYNVEGTFDPKYPRRKAVISVADIENENRVVEQADLGSGQYQSDIAFNFILGWEKGGDKTVTPHIRKESEREYTFVLNGRESFDELPSSIEFLRDAMDPNAVTPFLMLALVNFLDETDKDIDAQQEQRITSFQKSLLNQAVKTLFGEELIENSPVEIKRTGKRVVEAVFSHAMKDVYSDYNTLITSTRYDQMIADYIDFLTSLQTVSLCRGRDTLTETKKDIASRFNLKNTSSFEGRIKKHYSELLEVENTDKDEFEVRATLHPFEQYIVDELESGNRDTFPLDEAQRIALEKGYRREEIETIFNLLANRRIVAPNENDELELLETDYTIEQVQELIEEIEESLEKIEAIDEESIPENIHQTLKTFEQEIEQANPEDGEYLEQLYFRVKDQHDKVEKKGEILHSRYHQSCKELKTRVDRTSREIVPDHLEKTIEGGVQFVGGLNDARTAIRSEYTEIENDLTKIGTELENVLEQQEEAGIESAVILAQKSDELEKELDLLEEEAKKLEEKTEKLKDWKTFTSRVAGVKEQITTFANTFSDDSMNVKEDIDDLISQISECFASDPVGALDNLEGFKENLKRIKQEYNANRSKHQNVFDEKREELKNVLTQATDGKAKGLRSAKFSIKNPEESRRDLLTKFKEAYEANVIERAEENLKNARREVEYAKIVGIADTVKRRPKSIEEEIDTAEATVKSVRSDLDQYSFTDIGDETSLGTDGEEILSKTQEIREDAMEFRHEQEPDDEEIAETLERIEERRKIDFKDLLMEYHDDGNDIEPEDLLERIQRLFVLNQIDITISQRRGR